MGCIHTPNPYSSPCGDCRARDLEDTLRAERKLRRAAEKLANDTAEEAEVERKYRLRETARAEDERSLRIAAERERDHYATTMGRCHDCGTECPTQSDALTIAKAEIGMLRSMISKLQSIGAVEPILAVLHHAAEFIRPDETAAHAIKRMALALHQAREERDFANKRAHDVVRFVETIKREERSLGRIDSLRAVVLGAHMLRSERSLGTYVRSMAAWIEGQALRALVEHGQGDAARILAEREEYEHG